MHLVSGLNWTMGLMYVFQILSSVETFLASTVTSCQTNPFYFSHIQLGLCSDTKLTAVFIFSTCFSSPSTATDIAKFSSGLHLTFVLNCNK